MTDYNLLTFKAITSFVNDLSEIFSADNHELKLYQHLINKTTISHEKAIEKHIEAFTTFCIKNREAIVSKDNSKLIDDIRYSDKVFIDVKSILQSTDKETANVIWKHILTISAFVDPSGRAKEILKQNASNESNLISDIINKVEENVDLNQANPLEAVSSIMSSGIFTDLMMGMNTKLQDGSIDVGKLMNTVQQLCATIGGPDGKGGGGGDIMNLLKTVLPVPPSSPNPVVELAEEALD
jgi:hypothetical protein